MAEESNRLGSNPEGVQVGSPLGQGSKRVIEIYQQPPLSVTQSGWHFFAEG
jgi:hypothetical protein